MERLPIPHFPQRSMARSPDDLINTGLVLAAGHPGQHHAVTISVSPSANATYSPGNGITISGNNSVPGNAIRTGLCAVVH